MADELLVLLGLPDDKETADRLGAAITEVAAVLGTWSGRGDSNLLLAGAAAFCSGCFVPLCLDPEATEERMVAAVRMGARHAAGLMDSIDPSQRPAMDGEREDAIKRGMN